MSSTFTGSLRLLSSRRVFVCTIPTCRSLTYSSRTKLFESKKNLIYFQVRTFKDFDHGLQKWPYDKAVTAFIFMLGLGLVIDWEPYALAYEMKKDAEREARREALRDQEDPVTASAEYQPVKSAEEQSEGKPKKEKLGFRDRKVNTT